MMDRRILISLALILLLVTFVSAAVPFEFPSIGIQYTTMPGSDQIAANSSRYTYNLPESLRRFFGNQGYNNPNISSRVLTSSKYNEFLQDSAARVGISKPTTVAEYKSVENILRTSGEQGGIVPEWITDPKTGTPIVKRYTIAKAKTSSATTTLKIVRKTPAKKPTPKVKAGTKPPAAPVRATPAATVEPAPPNPTLIEDGAMGPEWARGTGGTEDIISKGSEPPPLPADGAGKGAIKSLPGDAAKPPPLPNVKLSPKWYSFRLSTLGWAAGAATVIAELANLGILIYMVNLDKVTNIPKIGPEGVSIDLENDPDVKKEMYTYTVEGFGDVDSKYKIVPNAKYNVYYTNYLIKGLAEDRSFMMSLFTALSGPLEEQLIERRVNPIVENVRYTVYKTEGEETTFAFNATCVLNESTRNYSCGLSEEDKKRLEDGKSYLLMVIVQYSPALYIGEEVMKSSQLDLRSNKCNFDLRGKTNEEKSAATDYCEFYGLLYSGDVESELEYLKSNKNKEVFYEPLKNFIGDYAKQESFKEKINRYVAAGNKVLQSEGVLDGLKNYLSGSMMAASDFMAPAMNTIFPANKMASAGVSTTAAVIASELAYEDYVKVLDAVANPDNHLGAGAVIMGLPVFKEFTYSEGEISKELTPTTSDSGYVIFKLASPFLNTLPTIRFSGTSVMWDMDKYSKRPTALHNIMIGDKIVASSANPADATKLFFRQMKINGEDSWVVVINNLPSKSTTEVPVVWSAQFDADGSITTGVGGFKIAPGGDDITPGVCGEFDDIVVEKVGDDDTFVCNPRVTSVNTSGTGAAVGSQVGTPVCAVGPPNPDLPVATSGPSCQHESEIVNLNAQIESLQTDYWNLANEYFEQDLALQSEIDRLKNESTLAGQQATDYKKALDDLAAARAQVNTLQAQNTNLTSQVAATNAQVDAITTNLTQQTSASAASSSEATSQIEDLKKQLASAKSITNNLQGTLTTTNASLAAAQKREQDLKGTITNLNASAAASAASLTNRVDELAKQNLELEKSRAELLDALAKVPPICPPMGPGGTDLVSIKPGCINLNSPPSPAESARLTDAQAKELVDALNKLKVSTDASQSFITISSPDGSKKIDFKKTGAKEYIFEASPEYPFSLEQVSFGSGLAFVSDVPAVIKNSDGSQTNNPFFVQYSKIAFDAVSTNRYALSRSSMQWSLIEN